MRYASSIWRSVAALRASLRDRVMPPPVDTTMAWIRSPTATSMPPSASLSSSRSMVASPLPPTSTNATSSPIATTVPSTLWPLSRYAACTEASNIAAKSSSGSVTLRSWR